MEIRDAVESDFEEITAIYNEVLTHSTAIYNDQADDCAGKAGMVASATAAGISCAGRHRRRRG